MNALSEYLEAKARENDLSIRGFARRCDIAVETARRLLQGTLDPKDTTLEKVANGLRVPLGKLRELSGIDPGRKKFAWPADFDELTDHERRVLVQTGRLFLENRGVRRGNDEQPQVDPVEVPVEGVGGTVSVLRPEVSPRPRVTRAAWKDVTGSDTDGRSSST